LYTPFNITEGAMSGSVAFVAIYLRRRVLSASNRELGACDLHQRDIIRLVVALSS